MLTAPLADGWPLALGSDLLWLASGARFNPVTASCWTGLNPVMIKKNLANQQFPVTVQMPDSVHSKLKLAFHNKLLLGQAVVNITVP